MRPITDAAACCALAATGHAAQDGDALASFHVIDPGIDPGRQWIISLANAETTPRYDVMDGDVLHPQWGRSGRQDLLQLLRTHLCHSTINFAVVMHSSVFT